MRVTCPVRVGAMFSPGSRYFGRRLRSGAGSVSRSDAATVHDPLGCLGEASLDATCAAASWTRFESSERQSSVRSASDLITSPAARHSFSSSALPRCSPRGRTACPRRRFQHGQDWLGQMDAVSGPRLQPCALLGVAWRHVNSTAFRECCQAIRDLSTTPEPYWAVLNQLHS